MSLYMPLQLDIGFTTCIMLNQPWRREREASKFEYIRDVVQPERCSVTPKSSKSQLLGPIQDRRTELGCIVITPEFIEIISYASY
jgi:hypothetical protein